MVVAQKQMTVAEYQAFIALPENSDRIFELINGELYEKMPTMQHGRILVRLAGRMDAYTEANPIGAVYSDVMHEIEGDDQNSRRPDIAFMSFERLKDEVTKGAVMIMPDLCIEIKSPTDSNILMREKAAFYIANGAKMVWLLFPAKKIIEVHKPNVDFEVLTIEDTLDGGEVLPGFSLPLKDIFRS